MQGSNLANIRTLYAAFQSPIGELDCGKKCAPYNELGVPFCCDILHAIPTAYDAEWEYLKAHTTLWQLWQHENPTVQEAILAALPDGQVAVACLGHLACQREYRTFTCRAFPFFPYITGDGDFIGLTYYLEYTDRCWLTSNLNAVTGKYRQEFVTTYDHIFAMMPAEKENFSQQSISTREQYLKAGKAIPLLHRNGHAYKVTPHNERIQRVPIEKMPRYGVYKIAAEMPFPEKNGETHRTKSPQDGDAR